MVSAMIVACIRAFENFKKRQKVDNKDRKSWNTLVPLVLGSVGLLTWFAYERLVPENPIMPLDIFNNWTTAAALFGTFIIGVSHNG